MKLLIFFAAFAAILGISEPSVLYDNLEDVELDRDERCAEDNTTESPNCTTPSGKTTGSGLTDPSSTPPVIVPTDPLIGKCELKNDCPTYVKTFDSLDYFHDGTCKYIAVKSEDIIINVKYSEENLIMYIEVLIFDVNIKMYPSMPSVYVNGIEESPDPFLHVSNNRILFVYSSVTESMRMGVNGVNIKVVADRAEIYLPMSMDTGGLCGIYDNDQSNDLTPPGGNQILDIPSFVESWKTYDADFPDC
ncbi:hypothetical protein CAPTEDRAFT_217609 [Capitella teleta]|uniref:VWFD domain-containing protein n=1 Tax=Capitella teleta TaxID=283909 RepID=R7UH31_CAPTE|nr:hypothetical protein CAPTEDRAFT_217609 [Capitella teleta]|eukprot:ELU05510.1 hypothetical protein CAPTEDRAFT_217609 [Capitella teleta]